MSPPPDRPKGPKPCFPRVSGDEPQLAVITDAATEFSPRERG